MKDLRLAVRQLAKLPGVSATIIVTLALGIGSCSVVFSLVDQVLLRPPDFPAADRVVVLRDTADAQAVGRGASRTSSADFVDWPANLDTLECVGARMRRSAVYTGGAEPLSARVLLITRDLPRVWRDSPALGRWFSADEYLPGHEAVVMVGYGFWKTAFGGAPDIIGRKVLLDGQSCTVVGVTSEKWDWILNTSEFNRPLVFSDKSDDGNLVRTSHKPQLNVFGRLRPGVTPAQAQAEMAVITARLAREHADANVTHGVEVVFFGAPTNQRALLLTLLAAVGSVLLMGCANVANLLLARATVRQREMSVRAALGASRGQLIRQLLGESVFLAVLGGLAGILISFWALDAVKALIASVPNTGGLRRVTMDERMLAFAAILSVASGVVFGFAPAWLASRVDFNESLKQGTHGSGEARSWTRLRSVLIVLQVASALVLLASAALFTRSFVALTSVNPGFSLEHTTTLRFEPLDAKYREKAPRRAFFDALLARIRVLPGVTSVAATSSGPFQGNLWYDFVVEGRPPGARGDSPKALCYSVTPDYFRTLGITLLRGRNFAAHDDERASLVLIVSDTLARQQFPNDDPIGRQLQFPKFRMTGTIIGVAADCRWDELERDNVAQIYFPLLQGGDPKFVMVRSPDVTALHAALKAQVHALDRNQPVTLLTMAESVNAINWRQRLIMQLLITFAGFALIVAASGIYAVIAYTVSRRTAEIGVRMALGATESDIVIGVLREGTRLVAAGVIAGLAGTVVVGRIVQSQLYGMRALDLPSLLSAAMFLLLIGLLACWLPARRASRVDPTEALRTE